NPENLPRTIGLLPKQWPAGVAPLQVSCPLRVNPVLPTCCPCPCSGIARIVIDLGVICHLAVLWIVVRARRPARHTYWHTVVTTLRVVSVTGNRRCKVGAVDEGQLKWCV